MKRTLTILALGVGLAAASSALAQSAADQARAQFEQGLALTEQERWEEALRAFDESLRLYPTETALYNRALCLGLAGRPADGVRAFAEYLQLYGGRISEQQRAAAEQELQRLRGRVGTVEIHVEGAPGAEVVMDGVSAGQVSAASPLAVNPGRHNVTIQAEGFQPVSRWVEVAAGGTVQVVLALERTTAPQPPAPAAASTENTTAACQDGVDNDGDGFGDCADQDCSVFVFCASAATPPSQPPIQPVAPAPTPSTGWSLGAGITGLSLTFLVLGTGLGSAFAADGDTGSSIALGAVSWVLLAAGQPIINAGSRSARRTGVRGCRGCRVAGWVFYGVSLLDSLVGLIIPAMDGGSSPAVIAAGAVGGFLSLTLATIDAWVAWSQARRAARAAQQAPADPFAAPAQPAARRFQLAPFVAPVADANGAIGGGAVLGFNLVH